MIRNCVLKRFFDIVFSFLGLIVFFPVLVILSIMIHLKLGSPIFFTQVRPGLGGKPFKMIKFRTMRDAVDNDGALSLMVSE